MGSFWIVENGKAIEHVGRPTRAGNTSFAIGCSDETYRNAGLYLHVDWTGTYDQRTQDMSTPRFIVNEVAKEVRVEYDIFKKTVNQVATYDAEKAAQVAEAEAEAIRQAVAQVAKEELIAAAIIKLTYAELDAYIDTNVTDFVKATTYLKKLSRVVKALVERIE